MWKEAQHVSSKTGALIFSILNQGNLAQTNCFDIRREGVSHLGQIKAAYMEPGGDINVFYFEDEAVQYGLSLLPESPVDKKKEYDSVININDHPANAELDLWDISKASHGRLSFRDLLENKEITVQRTKTNFVKIDIAGYTTKMLLEQ